MKSSSQQSQENRADVQDRHRGSLIAAEIASIQRHLLPAALPVVPGYRVGVYYKPCEAAGGDYYGFMGFDDGRLGIVIADVAGHGAAAAVMMAVLRTALASFRVFGRLRENAAQDVNAVLHEISVPGVFVTAFFVSLDPPTGRLFGGNCGHPPPLIRRRSGGVELIRGDADLPLGIVSSLAPPMTTTQLEPGDAMIMFTDGITELRNLNREFFGEARLSQSVASAESNDPDAIIASILHATTTHAAGEPAIDDQCLVVCSRLG